MKHSFRARVENPALFLERSGWEFLQEGTGRGGVYWLCAHRTPPSLVVYVRPLMSVIVAVRSSAARTETSAAVAGKATRRHVRPSVDSRTTPSCPTIQQIDAEGAEPAVNALNVNAAGNATPVGCSSQVAPPSVECSTMRRLVIRQRLIESGEMISGARALASAVDFAVESAAAGANAREATLGRESGTGVAAGGRGGGGRRGRRLGWLLRGRLTLLRLFWRSNG